MLFGLIPTAAAEPKPEDVRALPPEQQWLAYQVLRDHGSVARLSLDQAIQVGGLDNGEAAWFARLHGQVADLVFDVERGRWVPRERPEWRRRRR